MVKEISRGSWIVDLLELSTLSQKEKFFNPIKYNRGNPFNDTS